MATTLSTLDVNVNVKYNAPMKSTDLSACDGNDDASIWGIQDFADMYEVTPRALRFYEAKGLLNPARQSGGRIYNAEDKLRIEEILRGKRVGFTLEDIKIVMDVADGKVTDRDELLTRRDNFRKVIGSLRRRRKDIEILTAHMAELCDGIDRFEAETANQSAVFKYAQAYDAALRKHMDDEFGFEDVSPSLLSSHRH